MFKSLAFNFVTTFFFLVGEGVFVSDLDLTGEDALEEGLDEECTSYKLGSKLFMLMSGMSEVEARILPCRRFPFFVLLGDIPGSFALPEDARSVGRPRTLLFGSSRFGACGIASRLCRRLCLLLTGEIFGFSRRCGDDIFCCDCFHSLNKSFISLSCSLGMVARIFNDERRLPWLFLGLLERAADASLMERNFSSSSFAERSECSNSGTSNTKLESSLSKFNAGVL